MFTKSFNAFPALKDVYKRQKEYRANKWKNTTLMTINNFKEAFKKGINNVYDIADYFNLSTNTVEFAYNYYKENGYL